VDSRVKEKIEVIDAKLERLIEKFYSVNEKVKELPKSQEAIKRMTDAFGVEKDLILSAFLLNFTDLQSFKENFELFCEKLPSYILTIKRTETDPSDIKNNYMMYIIQKSLNKALGNSSNIFIKKYKEVFGFDLLEIKSIVKQIILKLQETLAQYTGIYSTKMETPFGKYWNMHRLGSQMKDGKPMINWAKSMRNDGITGIVDYGSGIVHPSEPNQAVFFSKNVIRHIGTFEVKSPKNKDLSTKNLDKLSQKQLINILDNANILPVTRLDVFKRLNPENMVKYYNDPDPNIRKFVAKKFET
jgi:hypothetical protein